MNVGSNRTSWLQHLRDIKHVANLQSTRKDVGAILKTKYCLDYLILSSIVFISITTKIYIWHHIFMHLDAMASWVR